MSMFPMERRSRNTLVVVVAAAIGVVIIIIIIVIIIIIIIVIIINGNDEEAEKKRQAGLSTCPTDLRFHFVIFVVTNKRCRRLCEYTCVIVISFLHLRCH